MLLQKLLNAQNQTLDDNKKGENDEIVSMPQILTQEAVGPSTTSASAPKKRKLSTQSQRDEEKNKAKRGSTDERRKAREATMALEN